MTCPLETARALYASCYTAEPSNPWLRRWTQDWLATHGHRLIEDCTADELMAYVAELRVAFREHRAALNVLAQELAEASRSGNPS